MGASKIDPDLTGQMQFISSVSMQKGVSIKEQIARRARKRKNECDGDASMYAGFKYQRPHHTPNSSIS
jgi:hypothetical protein